MWSSELPDRKQIDVGRLVAAAKLGRERRDAQVETCTVFAAALHDVLVENGVQAKVAVASRKGVTASGTWHHSVVESGGRYFDSMGEFSREILRKRLKIHPKVEFVVEIGPDRREGLYEAEDYEGLYEFMVKALRKAVPTSVPAAEAPGFRI